MPRGTRRESRGGGERASLGEHDVAEGGVRRAVGPRDRVDRHTARDAHGADARPEPPLLVDRRLAGRRWRRRRRWLLLLLRGLALELVLELVDDQLDLVAILGVGRELQVALEAEDRVLVVTEVPVALADVVEEVGDRRRIERLLVLVEREIELAEREQLLALVEVALRGACRGVLGERHARERQQGAQ